MKKLKKKQILVGCILAIVCFWVIQKLVLKQSSIWLIITFIAIAAYLTTITVYSIIELCFAQKDSIISSVTREYDPKDIFLLTTEIISNYDDGKGWGPRYITECYLAIQKEESFHELFSGVKIITESEINKGWGVCKNFNTPYVIKVEPLTNYVRDSDKKLSVDLLFSFITEVNTDNRLASEDSDEEEDV